MKPGDLVYIRIPNGWVLHDHLDGQVGVLLELGEKERSGKSSDHATVLVNSARRIVSLRLLEPLHG